MAQHSDPREPSRRARLLQSCSASRCPREPGKLHCSSSGLLQGQARLPRAEHRGAGRAARDDRSACDCASSGSCASIAGRVYIGHPKLMPLCCFARSSLILSTATPTCRRASSAALGIVLCGVLGDYETGYEMGKLVAAAGREVACAASTPAGPSMVLTPSSGTGRSRSSTSLRALPGGLTSAGWKRATSSTRRISAHTYCHHSYLAGARARRSWSGR